MGLISSFIGGAGKGMADAGKMMFADKLQGERDEANFLRDKELNKNKQAHESGEKQKDRDASMAETKYKSDTKASDKDKPTSNMLNAAALRAKGYPKEIADAAAHNAFEEVKDVDTGDMVLINTLTNKPIGRLTTIGNKKQWLPEGEEPELAKVTSKHRKAAMKSTNKKAGMWRTDATDFPSTEGDRSEWTKKEAQRLANEERASGKKSGGIVSNKMNNQSAEVPEKPPVQETKMIGKRSMTKEDFVAKMVKQYGDSPEIMKEIESTWAGIK